MSENGELQNFVLVHFYIKFNNYRLLEACELQYQFDEILKVYTLFFFVVFRPTNHGVIDGSLCSVV